MLFVIAALHFIAPGLPMNSPLNACREDDRVKLIGKPAPRMKVERWTSNDQLPKLDKFNPGQLYLIHFHSAGPFKTERFLKLTSQPTKEKVIVILIDSRDPATTEDFLGEKVSGIEPPVQNRELLTDIRYLADSEFEMIKKFFPQDHQKGIRQSLVVGKEGQIEWVGHLPEAQTVIKKVREGRWDRLDYASYLKDNSRVFKAISEFLAAAKSPSNQQLVQELIQKHRAEFKDLRSKRLRAIFSASCFDALLKVDSPEKLNALKTAQKESGEHTDAIVSSCWTFAVRARELNSTGKKIDQKVNQALIKTLSQIEKDYPSRVDVIHTKSQLLYLGGKLNEAVAAQEKLLKLPAGRGYPDNDLRKWKSERNASRKWKSERNASKR